MTTALYEALRNAEKAFNDENTIASLDAYEQAERIYENTVGAKRTEWRAIAEGSTKMSAATNADETEGCELDRLRWLEIAIMTYHMS
jgi:hypothetical protein